MKGPGALPESEERLDRLYCAITGHLRYPCIASANASPALKVRSIDNVAELYLQFLGGIEREEGRVLVQERILLLKVLPDAAGIEDQACICSLVFHHYERSSLLSTPLPKRLRRRAVRIGGVVNKVAIPFCLFQRQRFPGVHCVDLVSSDYFIVLLSCLTILPDC